MDAVISSYLLWRAARHPEGVKFVFVPAGGGGDSDPDNGWFVLDTGFGMFDHHQERSRFANAAAAVYSWISPRLSEEECFVASLFVAMASTYDSGNARELFSEDPFKHALGEAFSVAAILQAFLYAFPASSSIEDTKRRSSDAMKRTLEILRYLFNRKLGHIKAKKALDNLEEWVSPCDRVVLLKDSDKRHTKLEEGIGRKVVVYYSQSGNMGLVTTGAGRDVNLKAFADSEAFQKLFDSRKEEKDEWFVHKMGQAVIRAKFDETYKMRTPSIVCPKRLAEAVTEWMAELSS